MKKSYMPFMVTGLVLMLIVSFYFSREPLRELFASGVWARTTTIYYAVYFMFLVISVRVAIMVGGEVVKFSQETERGIDFLKGGDDFDGNEIWRLYKDTFTDGKTGADAGAYFNKESVFGEYRYPYLAAFKIIASSFLGLGILGTFIGFASGISTLNFEAQETQELVASIESLVKGGLATAFNTSIAGVFSSLIYNFLIYHPVVHTIDSYFLNLSDELDRQFYVSVQESLERFGAKVGSSMTDFASDVGGEVSSAVLGGIHEELASLKETMSLASEKMQSAAESVETMVSVIDDDISQKLSSLADKMTATLESGRLVAEKFGEITERFTEIKEQIDSAGVEFGNATDEIRTAVSTLTDSGKTINDLIASAQTQEKTSTENLVRAAQDATNMLSEFKQVDKNIGNILKQITENIQRYNEDVGRTLSSYLTGFAESSGKFASSVRGTITSWEESLENFTVKVGEFDKSVKELESALVAEGHK